MKELRCVHRHTIKEHPKCFKKGLIKGNFKNDKEFEKLTGLPWYRNPGYKICYLDIESDGLKADFSTMLTWCVKEKDGPITSSVITQKELFNLEFDKRLIQELIDEISKYNIIVGYFSTGFDVPYVRSKALHYGIDFPTYGEIYHWDIYYTAREKLCLSRNSLDNVCDYLGIKGKTPIDKEVWRRAKYGDVLALQQVLLHNQQDCVILEELHNALDFSRKWLRRSV